MSAVDVVGAACFITAFEDAAVVSPCNTFNGGKIDVE
jgi:hypothetical protein